MEREEKKKGVTRFTTYIWELLANLPYGVPDHELGFGEATQVHDMSARSGAEEARCKAVPAVMKSGLG